MFDAKKHDLDYAYLGIDNIKDVVALSESRFCWSIYYYALSDVYRGKVTYTHHYHIITEDAKIDTRLCCDMSFYMQTTLINLRRLRKYDPIKHCWEDGWGDRTVRIDNRRNRKLLFNFLAKLTGVQKFNALCLSVTRPANLVNPETPWSQLRKS
jgi:hypothetical protein